jgi:cytosine deaminase
MTGPGFFTPPAADRYALRCARVPRSLLAAPPADPRQHEDFTTCDIVVENGRIADVAPAGSVDAGLGPDLDASIVLPGLIDAHAHLDKGHIWRRSPNLSGDTRGAAMATTADRSANWTAEDVRRRMSFGLAVAYAKGVVAIRTHLDSLAPQASITFPVFRTLREEWAGRIELQASSIGPIDIFMSDAGRELADIVAKSQGNLGCGSRFVQPLPEIVPPELDIAYNNLFALAEERGLDIDLHVDESGDIDARALIRIARIALKRNFKGRILCGHCCALALQTDELIDETLKACREAGIDIVSLPSVNLYLQGRTTRRTPKWRGVTLLHEMKAHGLKVAIAGDNVRAPFHAYGDHDMLDTYTQAVRILHLDHPFDDWITSVTTMPAAIMGLECKGRIARGAAADLLVLRARDYGEMIARFQADRVIIRAGRAIDTTLPDYRQLDDIPGLGP